MTLSLEETQSHSINHSRYILLKQGLGAGRKYLLKRGSWGPGSERGRGWKSPDATERPGEQQDAATSAADNRLLQQPGHRTSSETDEEPVFVTVCSGETAF